MFRPKLKSVALPVPEIIATEVLVGNCKPPSLWKRRPQGSGMVPLERALVTSYRPPIVTFSLSLHVSDNAAFVLQHATFSHPTSNLPQISQCSPGSRWMAFGLRRAKVLGLIVCAISFQDFQPMCS